MKRFNKILSASNIYSQGQNYFYALLLLGTMTIGTACSNNNNSTKTSSTANTTPTQGNETVVLTDFADHLVIPTYQELIAKSSQLQQAVATFVETLNEQNLKATRIPREQSEAFAFGPAESLGYDANLDD